MKATTLKERFVSKIKKTDSCRIWTGAKNKEGYGLIKIKGKMHRAHRVSYELFNGSIPDGCILLHMCDSPSCVRPDHLQPGSYRDNTLDMIAKGRGVIFGGNAKTSQLKGASRRRGKTISNTLPFVLKEIQHLMENGIKPTLRRCQLIPGYHAVHHIYKHNDILAMARRCG